MQIGLEWKKLQKIDDLVKKETAETLAARTFTLANAIIPA
jgi:hypothetical protein